MTVTEKDVGRWWFGAAAASGETPYYSVFGTVFWTEVSGTNEGERWQFQRWPGYRR
jgi:hypothetical protein